MPAPPKLCRSWPQERDPKKTTDSEAQEEKKMVVYEEQYKSTMVDQELDEAKVFTTYQVQGSLSSLNI